MRGLVLNGRDNNWLLLRGALLLLLMKELTQVFLDVLHYLRINILCLVLWRLELTVIILLNLFFNKSSLT